MTITSYAEVEKDARKLLRQEELILEVTEAIAAALASTNTTQAELARRLGVSRSAVSQLLDGGSNLTLRTLADVADALHQRIEVKFTPVGAIRWEGAGELLYWRSRSYGAQMETFMEPSDEGEAVSAC